MPSPKKRRWCYSSRVGTYEFFDHAADVGILSRAENLEDLFATSGRALMEWMGPAPKSDRLLVEGVALEADNRDELLVRWLQELLYLFHLHTAFWSGFSNLRISGCRLEATVSGTVLDAADLRLFQEIKAVTYHQAKVQERQGGWTARVILDL